MERTALDHSLQIGNVTVPNRCFLAPMSGVSDLPFRAMAAQFGAGLTVSEMVASEAFVDGMDEMQLKAASSGLNVEMVQLVGCEARWMEHAAKIIEGQGCDIIDINMGCPSRRVVNGYSGSALMRDLDHATSLIKAVVNAVSVPVTLKMRLGWDHDSINAPELAKRAEDIGVQMITVHGRTRCQLYKGSADWSLVHAVKDAVRIPVVVNGDIVDTHSAQTAMQESGADAVMIGRGSYGAPWLPGALAQSLSNEDVQRVSLDRVWLKDLYEGIVSFYGEQTGVRHGRKHLAWTLDRLNLDIDSQKLRAEMLQSHDALKVLSMVDEIFDRLSPSATCLKRAA